MQATHGKILRTTVLFVAIILIALSSSVFSVQPASAASNNLPVGKKPTSYCAVREVHLNGTRPLTSKCLKWQPITSKSGVSYCAVREVHLNGTQPLTTKCLKYQKYPV